MLLAVAPDVFHGIELRRVCRQKLQLDMAIQSSDKITHHPAAMHRQSVPNNGQPAADMSPEVSKELDYLGSFDAPREEPEVEVPHSNASHGRETFPVEGVLQHWSLAAGRPGSNPVRTLAQTALVDKHYRTTLLERFFFISGQRTRFHRRIAGSSRWMARPVGLWQLQPSDCNIRQTCPG